MKSDVEELMPRLLPVEFGAGTEVLDLNGPPRNPREYLRQVQLEASLCPEVVVAQIDPKKLKKKQTVNASVAGCHAAPVGFSPSLSWQQQQVSNFSDVRQNITKNRKHWSSQTLDDNVLMPKQTDEEGWKRFCLGETVYLGTSSCQTDAKPEPALDYSKGCWLYALLACLEKPLLPEAHSSIRQLARRCAQIRSKLESQEDEHLPALNLLICLVARYFEQNDLADQPE
ncbi:gem-associated protein 2 isoform X4 [Siniperca chuatsi]|uniref:gem-associated protein 2 isoform X4 n=1 Tax=Siniperca chuatsi TaxID=119488 RepID=UPI001CE1C7FE|nr:gem-associated protein 2 isoform X4 [Siniperca chuatsi]